MRSRDTKISVLLRSPFSLSGRPRLIAVGAFIAAVAFLPSPGVALRPVIDRFEAVPDCIFADPRRGILSYMVTLASRIRIAAIEQTCFPFGPCVTRTRGFYDERGGFPSRVATRIADPRANANVVGYELVATGEMEPWQDNAWTFATAAPSSTFCLPSHTSKAQVRSHVRRGYRVGCQSRECQLSDLFVSIRSPD